MGGRGDSLPTPFSDGSFDVITSVSVIPARFDAPALLREASRVLAPGGSFGASFDYWPGSWRERHASFGLD